MEENTLNNEWEESQDIIGDIQRAFDIIEKSSSRPFNQIEINGVKHG